MLNLSLNETFPIQILLSLSLNFLYRLGIPVFRAVTDLMACLVLFMIGASIFLLVFFFVYGNQHSGYQVRIDSDNQVSFIKCNLLCTPYMIGASMPQH